MLFVTSNSGYLFSSKSISYALPTLTIFGTSKYLLYSEVFLLLALFKALNGRVVSQKYFFSNPLRILFGYMLFLCLVSFVYGVTMIKYLNFMREILPLSLFLFIPSILKTKQDYYRLFNLLISLVYLLFLFQLFDLFTGSKIAFLFGETQIAVSNTYIYSGDIIDIEGEMNRIIYGTNILLLGFIGSLYFLLTKDPDTHFNKYYLYSIISIIVVSVIISGTRGWIIGVLFMLFIFIIILAKSNLKIIAGVLLPVIILFNISVVNLQIDKSLQRLETVLSLIGGDLTAEGTLKRIDVRGVRVLNKYYESPLVGFGFSQIYHEYRDYHVGNHTLLLNGGIIGYTLFIYFGLYYVISLYKRNRTLSKSNSYKNSLIVFVLGFVGMFIIHSTSASVYRFEVGFQAGVMLVIFFSFSDVIHKEATLEENIIENRKRTDL